jgi:hypothetical protein
LTHFHDHRVEHDEVRVDDGLDGPCADGERLRREWLLRVRYDLALRLIPGIDTDVGWRIRLEVVLGR